MKVLYQANPSFVRNNPFWFLFSLFLMFCGVMSYTEEHGLLLVMVGLFIIMGMWLSAKSRTITIDEEKTIIRIGLLAKNTSEIYHSDIRGVNVTQSITNRMFGVGALRIGSASDHISIKGIRNPQKVKEICLSIKRKGTPVCAAQV